MTSTGTIRAADRAQLAMMLEVTAYPKPGNVDRCHDYQTTTLEHFLASIIFVRPAFEQAEQGKEGIGKIILDAVRMTGGHRGGNTHFGAFILLVPLIAGGDIGGAISCVKQTSVEDALDFYRAFGMTQVRVLESDDLDVNDPKSVEKLKSRNMTLFDVMEYSSGHDIVAREWVNGYSLTRKGADLLMRHGDGRESIVRTFLDLLAYEPDTFIAKKHGLPVAVTVMEKAAEVRDGFLDLMSFDQECIDRGINPGSMADIIIASIYVALGEGWQWDC
jgi:triphosphoribosyl-dephospho-CoA synthase